jgi:hypothetical protein
MVTPRNPHPSHADSPVPGRPNGTLVSGVPVVTGGMLPAMFAEIGEAIREIQQSRLTLQALENLMVTMPELRAKLIAEMQRLLAEPKNTNAAAQVPPKKGRKAR